VLGKSRERVSRSCLLRQQVVLSWGLVIIKYPTSRRSENRIGSRRRVTGGQTQKITGPGNGVPLRRGTHSRRVGLKRTVVKGVWGGKYRNQNRNSSSSSETEKWMLERESGGPTGSGCKKGRKG